MALQDRLYNLYIFLMCIYNILNHIPECCNKSFLTSVPKNFQSKVREDDVEEPWSLYAPRRVVLGQWDRHSIHRHFASPHQKYCGIIVKDDLDGPGAGDAAWSALDVLHLNGEWPVHVLGKGVAAVSRKGILLAVERGVVPFTYSRAEAWGQQKT